MPFLVALLLLTPLVAQNDFPAQAARGEQLYRMQCAECHGRNLEGASGPALTGAGFLGNYSAQPIRNLADRVRKTMPFNLPGSLTQTQAVELTAFLLQRGNVAPGQTALDDASLAAAKFPEVRRAENPPPGETLGNLAELMRAIAFPNSNIVFNAQIKDPGAQAKKQPAAAGFDYVEWGATVYPGWLAIDQAALALTETAPLFLTPGRLCQNGRPVPVDRADWKRFTQQLVDVGREARRVSRARNHEALVEIAEKLNDACANCHKVYRDKGGAEGSGAVRCQP